MAQAKKKTRADKALDDLLSDGEKVARDIKAGDYDSDLAAIHEAIQSRVLDGAVTFAWRIHLDLDDGAVLDATEEDLTVSEAFMVERVTRGNWQDLNPVRSAEDCRALLSVLLTTRLDMKQAQVDEVVGRLTVHQALDAIDQYEVQGSPKDREPSSS